MKFYFAMADSRLTLRRLIKQICSKYVSVKLYLKLIYCCTNSVCERAPENGYRMCYGAILVIRLYIMSDCIL